MEVCIRAQPSVARVLRARCSRCRAPLKTELPLQLGASALTWPPHIFITIEHIGPGTNNAKHLMTSD